MTSAKSALHVHHRIAWHCVFRCVFLKCGRHAAESRSIGPISNQRFLLGRLLPQLSSSPTHRVVLLETLALSAAPAYATPSLLNQAG